jgi:hypothetical protein
VIGDRLGALWKVPTVVENVAGAGGNLGMDRVAKGPSDGSQICLVPPGIATNRISTPGCHLIPRRPLGITLTPLAPEFPPSPKRCRATTPPRGPVWRPRAGTPKAICDKIEADTKIICQDAVLKERLVAETVGTGATDFTAYVAAERGKWGNLITDL